MVEIISGSNANNLFINTSHRLLDVGEERSPRGMKTVEIKDAWLKLADPTQSIVTLPERGLNMDYLKGELQWYLTGSYDVEQIGKHSRFWYKLADDNGLVNSNYGKIAMREPNEHGITQFAWCEDALRNDPNTRQAVIMYNQPKHKSANNKDFVCTLSQLFRQERGKLESTVLMRSNDLIYGLSYDLPWFTGVQVELAKRLGLEPGEYNHYTASLHVYEKHFDMLKAMAGAKNE